MKKLIQIGACNGLDFAWETSIKNQDVECILIEPNPKSIKVLKENYKDVKNINYENLAISTQKCKKTLYVDNFNLNKYDAGEGVTPHASFNI